MTPRRAFPTFDPVRFLCLVLVVVSFPVLGHAATPNLVNGIAVIVGDAVITYKDIWLAMDRDLDLLERQYGHNRQLLSQKVAEHEKITLEQMVEDQLVLQEFQRAGYVIPESYFQSRIDEDIRRSGDRLTLIKGLQAQGLTFEGYRKRTRERVILQLMWREKVPQDPLISPTKIENYYVQHRDEFKLEDQVKLRMIVLTNNPANPSYSPVKVAEEIVAKLDEKVPFEELARVYSQGAQAQDGGEYGWMERRQLNTNLAQVAFKLDAGQHSQVIPAPNGAYVLKVEDKKISYTRTLAEVRDDIEGILIAEEKKRLRKKWIDQLKAKSFVRYFF